MTTQPTGSETTEKPPHAQPAEALDSSVADSRAAGDTGLPAGDKQAANEGTVLSDLAGAERERALRESLLGCASTPTSAATKAALATVATAAPPHHGHRDKGPVIQEEGKKDGPARSAAHDKGDGHSPPPASRESPAPPPDGAVGRGDRGDCSRSPGREDRDGRERERDGRDREQRDRDHREQRRDRREDGSRRHHHRERDSSRDRGRYSTREREREGERRHRRSRSRGRRSRSAPRRPNSRSPGRGRSRHSPPPRGRRRDSRSRSRSRSRSGGRRPKPSYDKGAVRRARLPRTLARSACRPPCATPSRSTGPPVPALAFGRSPRRSSAPRRAWPWAV